MAGMGAEPLPDTPPAQVDRDKVGSLFVGHASWLIQTAGLNILIDPVWSDRVSPSRFAGPKRHNEPGIAFEKLPKIDVVLVSHGHYDHLDIATLSKLAAKFSPRVITPLGNDVTMSGADSAISAEAYDWHHRVELGNGLAVTLVPTRHWTARGMFDRNKALWASFVLETPAGKIYIVCDSGYGDGGHFRRVAQAHGPLRLAILPIGAYEPRWFMRDQHMNPGRCREGAGRLRRAAGAGAPSRHVSTDRRGDRRAGEGAACRARCGEDTARKIRRAEAGTGGGDLAMLREQTRPLAPRGASSQRLTVAREPQSPRGGDGFPASLARNRRDSGYA